MTDIVIVVMMPAMDNQRGGSVSPIHFMLDDASPLFVGIKRWLCSRIGGQWQVGDRLPSIQELARQLAVSPNNVQLAVKELVREGVLFSRKRLGLYVRALPAEAGAALTPTRPRGRTRSASAADDVMRGRMIDLVVFNRPMVPFVQHMVEGFEQATRPSGVQTRLAHLDPAANTLPDKQDGWGLVLFNPGRGVSVPAGYQHVTVVSTADHLHPDLIARFDRIGVDQCQGGMLAGQTLKAAGCRGACFVGGRMYDDINRFDLTSAMRLHGFEQTWGSRLESSHVLHAFGYSMNSGAICFRNYMKLSPRPEGVFAASDELALGFLTAASAAGLKAGRDYSLVGFDGQYDHGVSDMSTLTTVQAPAHQMGEVAAQVMCQRCQEPHGPLRQVALPCVMRLRETVAIGRKRRRS